MSRIKPSFYRCLMHSHATEAVDPAVNKASSSMFTFLKAIKLSFKLINRYHSTPYRKATVQFLIKLLAFNCN